MSHSSATRKSGGNIEQSWSRRHRVSPGFSREGNAWEHQQSWLHPREAAPTEVSVFHQPDRGEIRTSPPLLCWWKVWCLALARQSSLLTSGDQRVTLNDSYLHKICCKYWISEDRLLLTHFFYFNKSTLKKKKDGVLELSRITVNTNTLF